LLGFLSLSLAMHSSAALTWTGVASANTLYAEGNWLDDNGAIPANNTINPGVALTAVTGGLVSISSGTGTPLNYNGNFILSAGDSLTVSNGKQLGSTAGATLTGGGAGAVLTVSNGGLLTTGAVSGFQSIIIDDAVVDLIGTSGINLFEGAATISIANSSSLVTQFVNHPTGGGEPGLISVDGTSMIQFLGSGDPINSQNGPLLLDLATGATLILNNAAEIDEQIGESNILVNGTLVTLANRNSLLSIVDGTAIAIPEPASTSIAGFFCALVLMRRRRN
jgi:hypothetical protein